MYARNSDRRPPQNQPRERAQRPVHISSPRSRDLIPPPDYGGTALHDAGEEEVISFNPRNEQINSNRRADTQPAITDDIIPDEPELMSDNDNEDKTVPSDDGGEPDRTEPRRPLISRGEYEESFGRRVVKKTHAGDNMTDKSLLPGILPPLSDEMLLIALIILFMMSGSDDEMIIILAFLLLMR